MEPLHDSWQAITLAEQEGRLTKFQLPIEQPIRMHWAPDLHFPFHNADVVAYIIDICRGCDIIGQIGDGLEAYGVSGHEKDPAVKHTLNDEAVMYREKFWLPIRRHNPNARLIQLYGNHEERIDRHVRKQSPALYDLPGHTLQDLIKADEYNIEVHPSSGLLIAGRRFKHGDIARQLGSARGEMIKHRKDGVSGHTHRCEHETIIDAEGYRTDWYSIGHATRPELLAYLKGKIPNWQLSGGITFTIYPDGRTDIQEHRLD